MRGLAEDANGAVIFGYAGQSACAAIPWGCVVGPRGRRRDGFRTAGGKTPTTEALRSSSTACFRGGAEDRPNAAFTLNAEHVGHLGSVTDG
jgi:hypothetical protein